MNNKSENSLAIELGEQLRAVRQQQHLSLQACAQDTKIPQQVLAMLEAGDYEQIPEGPYLGNYLRSYGRCLHFDVDALEQVIKQVASGRNPHLCAIKTNVPESRPHVTRRHRKSGPVLTIVVLLLIIAPIAWFATQETRRSQSEPVPLEAVDSSSELDNNDTAAIDASATDDSTSASDDTINVSADNLYIDNTLQHVLTNSSQNSSVFGESRTFADADAASVLPTTQADSRDMIAQISTSADATEQGDSGNADMDDAVLSADATDAASKAATSSDDASEPELVLQLAADSWVEITTQTGERLVYAVLAGGDDYTFSAKQDLRVTLGNAAAVTVLVDGSQADTQPYTRNSVARFRVVNEDDKSVLTGR